jgi:hypothetical protein
MAGTVFDKAVSGIYRGYGVVGVSIVEGCDLVDDFSGFLTRIKFLS